MRFRRSTLSVAAALASGLWLVAPAALAIPPAQAGEAQVDSKSDGPACSCPEAREKTSRPKFAGLGSGSLDESDEIAALASLQHALAAVGDGASYVWQRENGRLSGIVQPTASFRNGEGALCRHVIILLTTGQRTNKTEGTACRLSGGRWQLEG